MEDLTTGHGHRRLITTGHTAAIPGGCVFGDLTAFDGDCGELSHIDTTAISVFSGEPVVADHRTFVDQHRTGIFLIPGTLTDGIDTAAMTGSCIITDLAASDGHAATAPFYRAAGHNTATVTGSRIVVDLTIGDDHLGMRADISAATVVAGRILDNLGIGHIDRAPNVGHNAAAMGLGCIVLHNGLIDNVTNGQTGNIDTAAALLLRFIVLHQSAVQPEPGSDGLLLIDDRDVVFLDDITLIVGLSDNVSHRTDATGIVSGFVMMDVGGDHGTVFRLDIIDLDGRTAFAVYTTTPSTGGVVMDLTATDGCSGTVAGNAAAVTVVLLGGILDDSELLRVLFLEGRHDPQRLTVLIDDVIVLISLRLITKLSFVIGDLRIDDLQLATGHHANRTAVAAKVTGSGLVAAENSILHREGIAQGDALAVLIRIDSGAQIDSAAVACGYILLHLIADAIGIRFHGQRATSMHHDTATGLSLVCLNGTAIKLHNTFEINRKTSAVVVGDALTLKDIRSIDQLSAYIVGDVDTGQLCLCVVDHHAAAQAFIQFCFVGTVMSDRDLRHFQSILAAGHRSTINEHTATSGRGVVADLTAGGSLVAYSQGSGTVYSDTATGIVGSIVQNFRSLQPEVDSHDRKSTATATAHIFLRDLVGLITLIRRLCVCAGRFSVFLETLHLFPDVVVCDIGSGNRFLNSFTVLIGGILKLCADDTVCKRHGTGLLSGKVDTAAVAIVSAATEAGHIAIDPQVC